MDQLQPAHWINLIFSRLSLGDVGRIAQLNRYFRDAVSNPETWRMLFRRDLSEVRVPADHREAYRKFLSEIRGVFIYDQISDWSTICSHGYEKMFLTFMKMAPIERNIHTIVKSVIVSDSLHLLPLIPDSEEKRLEILDVIQDPKHPLVADIIANCDLTQHMIQKLIFSAIKVEDETLLIEMVSHCQNLGIMTPHLIIYAVHHPTVLPFIRKYLQPTTWQLNYVLSEATTVEALNHLVEWGANRFRFADAAIGPNTNMAYIDRLIELGANDFDTCLIRAVNHRNWPLVEKMIALGASTLDEALVSSCKYGDVDIIRKLLGYGARINWTQLDHTRPVVLKQLYSRKQRVIDYLESLQ